MCIYIFSPENSIEIEYASEAITLLDNNNDTNRPRSEVVMDLLIKNENEKDNINELYVIYPRAFYNVSIYGNNEFEIQENCLLIDRTPTFTTIDHPFNHFLRETPCKMFAYSDASGRWRLKSEQPDPTSFGDSILYDGYLCQNIEIEPYDQITPIQLFILMNLPKCSTILKVKLNQAIEPKEHHWLRWFVTETRVNTPLSLMSLRSRIRHWKHMIFNRSIINYYIVSPHDVLDELKNYLKAFTRQPPTNTADAKINFEAKKLLTLIEELTKDSLTTIRDWRIHIFPQDHWKLGSINEHGDIKRANIFPNILATSKGSYEPNLVYQWKTGEKHIKA